MKIIVAPDSFKGSLSSMQVAGLIEIGVCRVFPEAEVLKIPIADGGEGTVEAMVQSAGGRLVRHKVCGPLGTPVEAQYGLLDNGCAVIELAAASGLPLVPKGKRDASKTTTFGTGELILHAARAGCKRVIVGLGGSATNDGGLGIAQAFGVKFLDKEGKPLGHGGGELARLARIDATGIDPLLKDLEIRIACDVQNPLCGPKGASAVYGPQKGANEAQARELDAALSHYAACIKAQLGQSVAELPGTGAAGGASVPLLLFTKAALCSGIELVLDEADFDEKLKGTALVITGEGRIDAQSAFGKVPVGVGQRAKALGVPVLAIVGDIGPGAESVYDHGVSSIMCSVSRAMTLSEAIAQSETLLADAAERAMRMLCIGMDISEKGRG